MAWGALVGGLVAGLASGAVSAYSARQQQEATVDAYKHRHQWQIDDMRKAGLNPVLSATQGAGSVGSMAQMDTGTIAQGLSAASQLDLNRSQATQADTQAELNANSAREAKANADIAEATAKHYKDNPQDLATRAKYEAGMNPSTPIGAIQEKSSAMQQAFQGDLQYGLNKYYEVKNKWQQKRAKHKASPSKPKPSKPAVKMGKNRLSQQSLHHLR